MLKFFDRQMDGWSDYLLIGHLPNGIALIKGYGDIMDLVYAFINSNSHYRKYSKLCVM